MSRRRTTQQVFILPRKKHLQIEQEQTAPQSAASGSGGADEPNELQEFVDNYLTLADKALGFMRRPGPNHQLTISTCLHCQHTIAASNLKLLAFAENLHVCPAKRSGAPAHKDEAA
ncbi:MAG TPA: hypothetical protein VJQ50_10310 [Terriglobales bacterium]|nr:hypothetical protein [Terriglobales bacterium]